VQDALATAWRNVTEVASVVDAADVATVVSIEPYDHLKSVIERLQACW
jgi:hypothetical protein